MKAVSADGHAHADWSLQVEMYADPSARGGVLEPEGVVEIKFKKSDLLALMNRLDPEIVRLRNSGRTGDAAIAARQKQLLPVYHQVGSVQHSQNGQLRYNDKAELAGQHRIAL